MTLMFPRPPKPERGTARCKRWMNKVAEMTCIVCGQGWPVQLHHCAHDRFARRKSSDYDVLPLCVPCHEFRTNHATEFRERYGPDYGFLPLIRATMATIDWDK